MSSPGARVFESGLGSGALSMALLRAGADITGYEIRPDFAARAQANVAAFLGTGILAHYHVEIRDAYDGIEEMGLDRVVLDLPEPWRMLKSAEEALRPGGILLSYLPTIGQVDARCGTRSIAAPSAWRRPSRCWNAAGTSTADPSGPTIAWWPTPASSPRPASST